MIDILINLNLAKSAALEAGKILINSKTNLNIENPLMEKILSLKQILKLKNLLRGIFPVNLIFQCWARKPENLLRI